MIMPVLSLVILGNLFDTRLGQYFISYLTDSQDTFESGNSLAHLSLFAAGVESGMHFQTIMVDGTPVVRRYSPAPPAYNVCSCSIAFSCPDPLFDGAPFLCEHGDNCTKGTIVWTLPGITTGCTYYERLLTSDLRCFYNRTCINTFLSLFNVDMPKRLPLPDAAFQFTPLITSRRSKFQPTTKIETLFREFMLEEWIVRPYYEGHYNNCAPSACTYMVKRRSELLNVISTIISFFGGLVVTYRLLVPIAVRFAYWIALHCGRRDSQCNSQLGGSATGNSHRCML